MIVMGVKEVHGWMDGWWRDVSLASSDEFGRRGESPSESSPISFKNLDEGEPLLKFLVQEKGIVSRLIVLENLTR